MCRKRDPSSRTGTGTSPVSVSVSVPDATVESWSNDRRRGRDSLAVKLDGEPELDNHLHIVRPGHRPADTVLAARLRQEKRLVGGGEKLVFREVGGIGTRHAE